MKAWDELKDPKKLAIVIQIEMTVGQATEIRDHFAELKDKVEYWPFGAFRVALTEVIDQVEKTAFSFPPGTEKAAS